MAKVGKAGACLARVRAWADGKSGSTERIARRVLQEPEAVLNVSIASLARECGTSPSTVSRFCAMLGYSGYKEFQLDLAATLAHKPALSLDDFDASAPPGRILRHVFECNRQSLADTERLLDEDTIIRVARAVHAAERIVFLGIGGSGLVASEAAQRFISLGKVASAMVDPYQLVFVTGSVGPRSVVMGISHTGQTSLVVEGIREAAHRKAQTVALTNYPRSPLAAASRYRLFTAFREHRINAAVSSSRIAQMCIIDALYFIVASWASGEARALAEAAEERVRSMLRTTHGNSRGA